MKQYFELFGTFDVANTLMFIPTHPTVELTPQHIFHPLNDYFWEEDRDQFLPKILQGDQNMCEGLVH